MYLCSTIIGKTLEQRVKAKTTNNRKNVFSYVCCLFISNIYFTLHSNGVIDECHHVYAYKDGDFNDNLDNVTISQYMSPINPFLQSQYSLKFEKRGNGKCGIKT